MVFAFAADNRDAPPTDATLENRPMTDHPTKYATFGAGCFWCSEAMFENLDGVISVLSGYQGGELKKPTYKQVCRGDTGHAEVVRVEYDPTRVTYDELLDLFWKMHDPTTLNRQGADVGTQYRSIIFYHDEDQKAAAEKSLKAMDASGTFKNPIVTQIQSASDFYEAEAYHQDYYRNNPDAPYSRYIQSKLKKLDMK
jgi:peptide-methionine (S)-S-oxide reductase